MITGPKAPISAPPTGGPRVIVVHIATSRCELAASRSSRGTSDLRKAPLADLKPDVGGGDDHGDDQQEAEAEPAEGEGDRDAQGDGEAGQVHRDHDRALAAELYPGPERDRDGGARGLPHRGQRRHFAGSEPSTRITTIGNAPKASPVPNELTA